MPLPAEKTPHADDQWGTIWHPKRCPPWRRIKRRIPTRGLDRIENRMHAIRLVTRLDEGSCRMVRYANDHICPTECPGDAMTHPVAIVDVDVDEGLGPCEGGKDRARNGVARPVSGMQDLDPVAPDMGGEPQ